jgi:DNA-binding NarL/FixJ family response regulator
LPINISLINCIVVGVGFAIITWHIQDIINLKAKYHKINEEVKSLRESIKEDSTFDVDNCTKEQLISRCKDLKLSNDAIELAIELFINKTKQSIIADKMCIEEKSVQQHKRRLRKKLNN